VRGTILDGATKSGLGGALVQIQNAATSASGRSDVDGLVRLSVPAGSYQLVVRRIGYEPVQRQIVLSDSSSEFTLSLQPQAQKLAPVRVGAKGAGIYGIVMSGLLNRPMPYAKVQLAGARLDTLTDSDGSFFFDVKPGRYMIRIGRAGYATEMFTVDVGKDQVVDASTILDKSDQLEPKGMDGLFMDLDQRLRWMGQDGALITGSELRHVSANLLDAIMGSQSFIRQGLRLPILPVPTPRNRTAGALCVFINGRPEPSLPLEAFRLDDIESVEVYGPATNGPNPYQSGVSNEAAEFLSHMWPGKAPCSVMERTSLPVTMSKRMTATWVSIWTKR
jgi:hypothetical protein